MFGNWLNNGNNVSSQNGGHRKTLSTSIILLMSDQCEEFFLYRIEG